MQSTGRKRFLNSHFTSCSISFISETVKCNSSALLCLKERLKLFRNSIQFQLFLNLRISKFLFGFTPPADASPEHDYVIVGSRRTLHRNQSSRVPRRTHTLRYTFLIALTHSRFSIYSIFVKAEATRTVRNSEGHQEENNALTEGFYINLRNPITFVCSSSTISDMKSTKKKKPGCRTKAVNCVRRTQTCQCGTLCGRLLPGAKHRYTTQ